MMEQSTKKGLIDKASFLVSHFESSCDAKSLSPLTIFKIGSILYETKSIGIENHDYYENLAEDFYQLLANLNRNYLVHVIFHEINAAFVSTVGSSCKLLSGESNFQIVSSSIHAMCGIYGSLTMKQRGEKCLMKYAFDAKMCSTLIMCYDCLNESDLTVGLSSINELKTCIFHALSSLLLHGLIIPASMKKYEQLSEDAAIQTIMEVIQSLVDQSTESFCLGDLLYWEEHHQSKHNHSQPILSAVCSLFSNDVAAQKEYMISVLKSLPTSSQRDIMKSQQTQGRKVGSNSNPNDVNKDMNPTKQSALERLMNQVRSIFPLLGEGFIEVALACYNHDIEGTINALMEGEMNPASLHPRLQVLDKSLPARRKETKTQYDLGRHKVGDVIDKEDEEARGIQKARIKEMVAKQEDEAYKIGIAMAMDDKEYNDDYDDQYDGIGDGVGGADSGLYDVDFESIKTYNRVTREMEADQLFWEEHRNLNRSSKKERNIATDSKKDSQENEDEDEDEDEDESEGDQKKYRGPDKGRGGRILGPDGKYLPHPKNRKKVGGKGNQHPNTGKSSNAKNEETKGTTDSKKNDEMSKIQKRRKNDNKAKIANHHRKERALKKTGI